MPYIFIADDVYDVDSMGEAADVVSRDEIIAIEQERDTLRSERDEAVGMVDTLNAELKDARDRYARHVITNGEIINRAKQDVMGNGTAQSFADLFEDRTKG